MYNIGRKVLTPRGQGTISRDHSNDCDNSEVLVKLDTPYYAGVVSDAKYASLRPHNFDIIPKSAIIFKRFKHVKS